MSIGISNRHGYVRIFDGPSMILDGSQKNPYLITKNFQDSRREGELSGSGSLALDCPPPPPPKVKWLPNQGDSQGIVTVLLYFSKRC
jgi:hypothetical protein